VGLPTLALVGLYVGLVFALLIYSQVVGRNPGAGEAVLPTWSILGALLCVGPVLLAVAFLGLNLIWATYRRGRETPSAPDSSVTDVDAESRPTAAANDTISVEWRTRWLRLPVRLRKAVKLAAFVALLAFGIVFLSLSTHGRTEPGGAVVQRTEIGAFDPWFVYETTANGFQQRIDFITWSAGAGVIALLLGQALYQLRRWERPAVPDESAEDVVGPCRQAGTALTVAGLLIMLSWVPLVAGWSIFRVDINPSINRVVQEGVLPLTSLWSLIAGAVVLRGGLEMRKLRGGGWAATGSALAMVPLSAGVVVGLPVGLWAWLVLRRPEVKSEFQRLAWLEKNQEYESAGIVAGGRGAEPETLAYALGWLIGSVTRANRLWTALLCFGAAATVFAIWLEGVAEVRLAPNLHLSWGVMVAGTDLWQGIVIGVGMFLVGCLSVVLYPQLPPRAWCGLKLAAGITAVLLTGSLAARPPVDSPRSFAVTTLRGNDPQPLPQEWQEKGIHQMLHDGGRFALYAKGPLYLCLALGVGLIVSAAADASRAAKASS
jgi:hypothetical protein